MTIFKESQERMQSIKDAYALYFDLERKGLKGKDAVSKVFLTATSGEGIEFIQKRSFKGFRRIVGHKAGLLFGKKGALDIAQRLQKTSKILKHTAEASDAEYEQVAKELLIQPETLREHMFQLGVFVESLREYVHSERVKKGKKGELEYVPLFEKSVLESKGKADIDARLQMVVKEEQVRNKLVQFIEKSQEKKVLLGKIFDLSKGDGELKKVLYQAVLRSSAIEKNDRKRNELKQLLQSLVPENEEPPIKVEKKKIAIIFGDHFIRDSSMEVDEKIDVEEWKKEHPEVKDDALARNRIQEQLEGDVSSMPYIELLNAFIKEKKPFEEKELFSEKPSLGALFENAIDMREAGLSEDMLKRKIDNVLAKTGSCLMLGGWGTHAIAYEIEQLPYGKYAFRVYNKGAGLSLHGSFIPRYVEKHEPCVAYTGIKAEQLFGEQFLPNLLSMTKKVKGDSSLFYPQQKSFEPVEALSALLSLLGGKNEEIPSYVQTLVSEQQSGTCLFACVVACMARHLSPQDFKKTKVLFELFLLHNYQPACRELLPVSSANYNEARVSYSIISRSIEQFSKSVERAQDQLSQTEKQDVREMIDAYTNFLLDLDASIVACEKEKAGKVELDKVTENVRVNEPPTKVLTILGPPLDIQISPISPKERSVAVLIEEIPLVEDEEFSASCERAIGRLALEAGQGEISNQEFVRLADQLCRKLSSVQSWDKVRYELPDGAVQNLHRISQKLLENIKKDSVAEQYLLFLHFAYGLESAYRQCQGVPKLLGHFFSKGIGAKLEQLQCSDGYWVSCIREFKEKILPKSGELFPNVRLSKRNETTMDSALSTAVRDWWNSASNAPLKAQVDASIKADRQKQEEEIALKKDVATKEKDRLEQNKRVVDKELEKISKDLEENQRLLDQALAEYSKTSEAVANHKWAQLQKQIDEKEEKKELKQVQANPAFFQGLVQQEQEKIDKLNKEILFLTVEQDQYNADWDALQEKMQKKKMELDAYQQENKDLISKQKDKEKQQQTLSSEIDTLKDAINGGLEFWEKSSALYWPQNFETASKWEKFQAPFLFVKQKFFADKLGKGKEDLLPPLFRRYCETGLVAQNIFDKVTDRYDLSCCTPAFEGYERSYRLPDITVIRAIDVKGNDHGIQVVRHGVAQSRIAPATTFSLEKILRQPPPIKWCFSADSKVYALNSSLHDRYDKVLTQESGLRSFYGTPPTVQVGTQAEDVTEMGTTAWVAQEKDKKLAFDEMAELCTIRVERGVQIDAILSYFRDNPEKLRENKWINLFHALLFDSTILLDAIEDDKKREFLFREMHSFFTNRVKSLRELKAVDAAASLTWVAKSIEKYAASVSAARVQRGLAPIQVPSLVDDQLVVEVFSQSLAPECVAKQPLVFHALFSGAGRVFDEQSVRQIENDSQKKAVFATACFSLLFGRKKPLDLAHYCEPRIADEADAEVKLRQLMTKAADDPEIAKIIISAIKERGPEILAKMYPEFAPCTIEAGEKGDDYFINQNGKDVARFCLSSGMLIPVGVGALREYTDELPVEIRQLLTRDGLFSEEACLLMRGSKGPDNSYFVQCRKDLLAFVLIRGDTFFISFRRQGEPEWLACDFAKKVITNWELRNRYCLLQQGEVLQFCDPVTFTPVYERKQGSQDIIRCSDNKILVKPPESYRRFEDPDCSLAFTDASGKLQEVQFPRLNITLKRKDEVWRLDDEWEVSEEQVVPHLGEETGFLLVEKNEGKEKKVLIPVWNPKSQKKRALDFPYVNEFYGAQVRTGTYIECDLKEGELVPRTLAARYHLARILLERGEIDRAEKLLCAADALLTRNKLSSEEREILKNIAFTNASGDIGYRKTFLQTVAYLLLTKNDVQFPHVQKVEELYDSLERGGDLLEKYIKRVQGMRTLPVEDELFLLGDINEKSEALDKQINQLMGKKDKSAAENELLTNYDAGKKRRVKNLELIQQRNKELEIEKLPLVIKKPELKPHLTPQLFTFGRPLRVWSKIVYSVARRFGSLPFSPLTIRNRDLQLFLPYIEKELYKPGGWEQAERTGLLPSLHYMAVLSHDDNVKCLSYNLLLKASTNYCAKKNLFDALNQRTGIGRLAENRELVKLQENLDGLVPIHATEEAKEVYCEELREEIFEETPRKVSAGEDIPARIFPEGAPEKGEDKTVAQKFHDVAEDIEAAAQLVPESVFALKDGQDIQTLADTLELKLTEERKALAQMDEEITGMFALALTASPEAQLQFSAKKQHLPNINELCVIGAKVHCDEYMKVNYPQISAAGVKRLKKSIQQYLVQKQLCQQLERARDKAHAIDALPKEVSIEQKKSMIDELGRTLNAKRAYELDTDKYAMIFLFVETVFNIKLRSDQVKNIEDFINSVGENQSIVLHMIMGGGKTSVLQPILGFLLAEPGFLSIVDVPESLFEEVKELLAKSLGMSFGQYVYTSEFNRDLAKDKAYLKSFLRTLEEVRDRQACFLRVPKLQQCIVTSLYEAYFEGADKDTIDLLSKINELIETKARVQIDEIDFTMNPLVTFKFPVKEGAITPSVDPGRGKILTKLLYSLASDKALAQEVSIDFVNKFQKKLDPKFSAPKAVPITEELFFKRVQPKLVEKALVLLKKQIPGLEDTEGYVAHFLSQVTPFDEEVNKLSEEDRIELTEVCEELSDQELERDGSAIAQKILYQRKCTQWIEQHVLQTEERELIGVLADAISNVLKVSLLRECGSHYGKNKELYKPVKKAQFVAIPYSAPNAPKTTKFEDPYEQVLYTAQQALHDEIPPAVAEDILKFLQKQARNEIEQTGGTLEKTKAYTKFIRLFKDRPGQFLFLEEPPSAELVKAFHSAINSDEKFIIEYFERYLFNQIKVYTQSISATPQTLAGSSLLSSGYTGTLQEGILAMGMVGRPEKGTDGKTIAAIEKKMVDEISYVANLHEKEKKLTDQLIEKFVKEKDYDVLIDSGGWLKEEKVEVFAKNLLEACIPGRAHLKGVVYHNLKGEIMSYELMNDGSYQEIPLKNSRFKTTDGSLLTIIGQKHETGTNILQRTTAKAFVTVRKNMTLRDMLQSSFRMRGILLGQADSFLINDEVKNDVLDRITKGLKDKLQGKANLPEEFKNFPNAIRDGLIKAYEAHPESLDALLGEFRNTFTIDSPTIWRYLIVNQALAEQKKNWVAGQHKMRELLEKPIRMALHNTHIPLEDRRKFFDQIKSLVVQTKKDSPFEKMKHGVRVKTARAAINEEVQKYLNLLGQVTKLRGEGNQAAAQALGEIQQKYKNPEEALRKCVNPDAIPHTIELRGIAEGGEMEEEAEVEAEAEAEEELELEIEVQAEVMDKSLEIKPYVPLFAAIEDFVDHRDSSTKFPGDKVPLPDSEMIWYSPNMFPESRQISSFYNPPGRFLLCVRNKRTGETRYIVVSHRDAQEIKDKIFQRIGSAEADFRLVTFDGETVASLGRENAFDENELLRVSVQAKLNTGGRDFSIAQMKCLRELVTKPDGTVNKQVVSELRERYELIIKRKETSARAYKGSRIQKFFMQYGEKIVEVVPSAAFLFIEKEKYIDPMQINIFEAFLPNPYNYVQYLLKKSCLPTDATQKVSLARFQDSLRKHPSLQAEWGLQNRSNQEKLLNDAIAWLKKHWKERDTFSQ